MCCLQSRSGIRAGRWSGPAPMLWLSPGAPSPGLVWSSVCTATRARPRVPPCLHDFPRIPQGHGWISGKCEQIEFRKLLIDGTLRFYVIITYVLNETYQLHLLFV